MARPKNLNGGPPFRAGEPTRPVPCRLTVKEEARVAALAVAWGCSRAEAIRRAIDESYARVASERALG